MQNSARAILTGLLLLISRPGLQAAITSAAEVRGLDPGHARAQSPIHLRGVVTWVNARNGELFIQDRSAGIFVFLRNSKSDHPLCAGQIVDLEGVTAPGDFSSSVDKARIQVVAETGNMPAPVRLPFDRLLTGEQDSQWGQVEGVVRSGREDEGVLYLNAMTPGGAFLVITRDYRADWQARLVDSKVSFEGVLAAVFNDHRQVSGLRIFVPSARFIKIDAPAPAIPSAIPLSPALAVGAFRANQGWSHRVRVRATITAVVSRTLMYVSDGGANLAVEFGVPCPESADSLVDIIGFPGNVDGRPGLLDSSCTLVTPRKAEAASHVLVRDILPPDSPDQGSGLAIASGTRNDLRFVTVEGTLVQIARGLRTESLTVVSGDRNFMVTLADSGTFLADRIEPGSRLSITGVCLIAFDEYHRAQSFRLLARRPGDITVLARPAWLTVSRALWIIIPLALVVFVSLVWIAILRRHVTIKTEELRRANERLTRMAAEDALTSASNRRRFNDMFEEELERSSLHRAPLSLLMIDIDHFKAVNDLYGHQRGDQCLVEVVGALRKAIFPRPESLVSRYGGEEFAILLPDTGGELATFLAEKVRTCVKQLAITHEQSLCGQLLTVSVGVATSTPGSGQRPEHLIGMADHALYAAKQAGRNRVRVYNDVMSLAALSGGDSKTTAWYPAVIESVVTGDPLLK